MDVFGKVVSVEMNATITKQNGGTYQGARLSFRDGNGKLVEQNFTSQTLKYNPSIATALGNLNPGDEFIMEKLKEGEFWNVKSIKLSSSQSVQDAAPSNGKSQQATAKPVGSSSYASAEERALVQIYIVRQSNITAAINTLSVGSKGIKPEDVLTLAKKYENYVFGKGADLDSEDNTSDMSFEEEEYIL